MAIHRVLFFKSEHPRVLFTECVLIIQTDQAVLTLLYAGFFALQVLAKAVKVASTLGSVIVA